MALYVELGVFSTFDPSPFFIMLSSYGASCVLVHCTPKSIGWSCVKRRSWKIITGSQRTRTNRRRHLIWCKMITFFFFFKADMKGGRVSLSARKFAKYCINDQLALNLRTSSQAGPELFSVGSRDDILSLWSLALCSLSVIVLNKCMTIGSRC